MAVTRGRSFSFRRGTMFGLALLALLLPTQVSSNSSPPTSSSKYTIWVTGGGHQVTATFPQLNNLTIAGPKWVYCVNGPELKQGDTFTIKVKESREGDINLVLGPSPVSGSVPIYYYGVTNTYIDAKFTVEFLASESSCEGYHWRILSETVERFGPR